MWADPQIRPLYNYIRYRRSCYLCGSENNTTNTHIAAIAPLPSTMHPRTAVGGAAYI